MGYCSVQTLCSRMDDISVTCLVRPSAFFLPLHPSLSGFSLSSFSLMKGHCTRWQGEKIANQRSFCFHSCFPQDPTRPMGLLSASSCSQGSGMTFTGYTFSSQRGTALICPSAADACCSPEALLACLGFYCSRSPSADMSVPSVAGCVPEPFSA